MTGMDWARADMDPDDPMSQGYSPTPEQDAERAKLAEALQKMQSKVAELERAKITATVRLTLLANTLYVEDVVPDWFERPNRLLGGETPTEMIRRGKAGDVDDLLQGLADGVMG